MSTISGASNKAMGKLLPYRKDSKASVQDLSKYDFIVGDRVYIASNPDRLGTAVFNGTTRFSDGIWIGVALDKPFGKNNGVVQGVTYFQCEENHGIFVRPNNLRYASEKNSNTLKHQEENNKLNRDQLNNSSLPKDTEEHNFAEPFPVSISTSNLNLGDRVYVTGKSSNSIHKNGILRFLGYTKFSEGIWAGIELDNPVGKNDGSVNGVRYFSCKPQYGLFALDNKVKKLDLSIMKGGFNRMDSLSRFGGSSESVSSIASNFSSASRTRVRLGMNAVSTPHKFKGDRILENTVDKMKLSKTNVKEIKELDKTSSAIHNVLKEKEQHVEQLMREREIERIDLASATSKIDELEKNQAKNLISLNEQKLTYDKKINELQNNVYLVCQERDHLSERFEEERKKVEDLLFRMEEKDIDESDLENKTEENESQIFELHEKLALEREMREQLESKLKNVTLQNENTVDESKYVNEIKNLEGKLTKFELELKEERNNSKLKSTLKLLEEKEAIINDLQDRFEQAKLNVTENRKEVDLLKKLQVAHTDEIKSLKDEISNLQSFTGDLTKKITGIQRDVASDKLNNLTNNISVSSVDLAIQTEEDYSIINQTKEIIDLQTKIEIISEENKNIKLTLKDLEKQLQVNNIQSENRLAECNDLKQKCNQLDLQIIEQIKSKRSIVEENGNLCTQLSSNLDQLERLRSQVSDLHNDNRRLLECKSEIENKENNLKGELDKLRGRIVFLEKENGALIKSLEESQNDATRNSHILQMTIKIEDLESSIQESKKNLKTEKEKSMSLITQNATLYSNLEHLRQKRDDADNIMYDQLQSLKSINQLLESEKLLTTEAMEAKTKELIIIRDRLLKTSQEYESLQENFTESIQKLEREKRLVNDKLRKMEKQFEENEKKSQLALSESTVEKRRSDNKDQISLLKAAKENSEQQISFLNSVIIDREKKFSVLQLENQSLKDKLKDLENGNILSPSTPKKIIPPRLYCDVCEIFDSHDTEKCLVVITESTPSSPHLIVKKIKPIIKAPRIYCDICEIFDAHDTSDCQDQQTF